MNMTCRQVKFVFSMDEKRDWSNNNKSRVVFDGLENDGMGFVLSPVCSVTLAVQLAPALMPSASLSCSGFIFFFD